MKKINTAFVILIFGILSASAGNADLFSYSKAQLDQELSDISALENIVISNNGALPDNFSVEQYSLNMEINDPYDPVKESASNYPVFGIPSFCWGLCFSVPGIILVHVITNEYDESKKAFKGCVTMVAVYAVVYVVYLVFIYAYAYSAI